MRFALTSNLDETRRRLADARRQFQRDLPRVLDVLGVQVLSLSQLAYREKARGGRGSDGITWKPLAASTIKAKSRRGKRNANRKATKSGKVRPTGTAHEIGVDTGLQRASASPGFIAQGGGNIFDRQEHSVTVGYGRSYSKYFDAKRPLLPDVLPDKWTQRLEELLTRWGGDILRKGSE